MNGEELDALLARLESLVGKNVDMTFTDTHSGMSGKLEKVVVRVDAVLDYGYSMNAAAEGFEIKELPE